MRCGGYRVIGLNLCKGVVHSFVGRVLLSVIAEG
jgi:hypothetical protein